MNMMQMGGPPPQMNGGPPPPQMLQMHHHPHHVAVFASQSQPAPPLQTASATPPVPSSMNRSQSRASCPQSSTREMSSHRSTTSRRCGVCRGCQCKPCGQCTYCQDSPQFGGPGVKKQSCIERRCLRVLENRLQRDAPTFKARVGCNACEDCRMQDCQICLVCLDKRFFENRHIPGAMCAKKRCNNAQSIECVPSMPQNTIEFAPQRAPKRSYEMITPVQQQQQQQQQQQMHFDVKRVQYMQGPPQMMQQMQMHNQQQPSQQQQQQQQQRPNSNSSHSQGPSPPRNGVSQHTSPQQQNGVHMVKTDCIENLEQHQQQHHQQNAQQQQSQQHSQQQHNQHNQQQRMMFQPQPYTDMNGHSRMMAPPGPPPPVSSQGPMPLPQGQMTHMPQHGLDIPYLIPTFAPGGPSDFGFPSKFELDFEHNGDPFVPPSYAQDMKGQVVLQQL